jgi:hypothetical protein
MKRFGQKVWNIFLCEKMGMKKFASHKLTNYNVIVLHILCPPIQATVPKQTL